jgi:hypothetical protein
MTEEKNFETVSATPEAVYQLAADIDQFWSYGDGDDVRNVKHKEATVKRIAHYIDAGRTYYLILGIQAFVEAYVDGNSNSELVKTASSLLRRLNLMQRRR